MRRRLLACVGAALLIGAWQIVAMVSGSLALASPAQTLLALGALVRSPDFNANFWISLARIAAALAVGGFAGFALGIAAGLNRDLHDLLEPLRWVTMSVPPVTVLVLGMLFLGAGSAMVVAFASLLIAPAVYVNTVKGMELVDKPLAEMARAFRFPFSMRLRHLYIPALSAPLAAAMIQVVCSAVRVVILAEVMGAAEGIGAAVARSGSSLEIPTLYAWVLLSIGLVAAFEYLLLRPVQERLLRWTRI